MAPQCPTLLGLLGLRLVGQQSLSDFSITKRGKNTKTQNTRTPKSNLVQALEHLWHWPLRKSSCALGRNLRSGHQGPGSAGPRSCLLGWVRVRAAGGQSCVSGHPVGSGDRGAGAAGQGPPRGHCSQPSMSPPPAHTFSRWLWPLGPGLRPRSPSPEPSGEEPTTWGKGKEDRMREEAARAKVRGFRFKPCLCHSRLLVEDYFLSLSLGFFICQLGLIPPTPWVAGRGREEVGRRCGKY